MCISTRIRNIERKNSDSRTNWKKLLIPVLVELILAARIKGQKRQCGGKSAGSKKDDGIKILVDRRNRDL